MIVAGGKGTRMGGEIPKQFLELAGKPILMHSIGKFHAFDPTMKIILVLPATQIADWEQLCTLYEFQISHEIAAGGATRFESVQNGLSIIENEGIVFIHDGVRPLVSRQTILNCERVTEASGCAIPVIPLTDSIRQLTGHANFAVDRTQYRLIQTPQTFQVSLIKEAFRQAQTNDFSDDATVFEAAGYPIKLVDGNAENIKITTQTDLKIAEILLIKENQT